MEQWGVKGFEKQEIDFYNSAHILDHTLIKPVF